MIIIYEILLVIDGVIYDLVDHVYDIFDFLARINLFSEDSYNDIVGRIYIVLGVLMLFVLAYTLLRAIINPDEFSKGETSFANLAKNVVVSLIIIVMLPTVFKVAFNLQNAVLNTYTIEKIVFGNTTRYYTEEYKDTEITMRSGRMIAYNTFTSFFYPNPESLSCPNDGSRESIENCKDNIHVDRLFFFNGRLTLREVDAYVKDGKSMTNYAQFGKAIKNGDIIYYPLVSTACGIFLLYVLLNFVFDMALRIIKLMFYQIIAPIPVVCRIIPFGNFKDVFKNWLKQVSSVFFEVFVRIAIMNFGVLLIKLNLEAFNNNYRHGVLTLGSASYHISWIKFVLARVLIDMGIIAFIRKAPELISKLFGIDTGGMKLGLREKIAQGGGYVAAGAIGAAGGMAIRNGARGLQSTREGIRGVGTAYQEARQSGRGRLGAVWASRRSVGTAAGAFVRGAASTVAGAASGGVRAGYRARNAKNGNDMANATGAAVNIATSNATRRANYRAQHASERDGIRGWAETNWNVVRGHAEDRVENVADWVRGGDSRFSAELGVYDLLDRYRGNIETKSEEIRERSTDNNVLAQMTFEKQKADFMKKLPKADAESVREYLRSHITDFDSYDVADQDSLINTEVSRRRIENERRWQEELKTRYGDAQNLDEVRTRLHTLQNTVFDGKMYLDGQVFEDEAHFNAYLQEQQNQLNALQGTTYAGTMEIDGQSFSSEQDFNDYVADLETQSRDLDSITFSPGVTVNGLTFIDEATFNSHKQAIQEKYRRLQNVSYEPVMTINGRTFRSEQEFNNFIASERQRISNMHFAPTMEVDGRTFTSEQEFNNYVARAAHALNDLERDMNDTIRRTIVDEDRAAMTRLGWLDNNGNIKSGGVGDRIVNITENAQSSRETFNENVRIVHDNLGEYAPFADALRRGDLYDMIDNAGHAANQRRSAIVTQQERRSRRNAGNNNGGNNGGGGHGGH